MNTSARRGSLTPSRTPVRGSVGNNTSSRSGISTSTPFKSNDSVVLPPEPPVTLTSQISQQSVEEDRHSVLPLHFDLTDLIRGQGEWTNMQDVVRKAFKFLFQQVERQQEHISALTGLVSTLKGQVGSVAQQQSTLAATVSSGSNRGVTVADSNIVDLDSLLKGKQSQTQMIVDKVLDSMDDIKLQISNMKSEIERKASVRYVDDQLRRKVDKSDNLIMASSNHASSSNQLASSSSLSSSSDLKRIYKEVNELKSKIETITKEKHNMAIEIQNRALASDTKSIQNQVNEVYSIVSACPSKEQIDHALHKKMNVHDMETALNGKIDKTQIITSVSRIEKVVAEHEKLITFLRLRVNDETVLDVLPELGTQVFHHTVTHPAPFRPSSSTLASADSRTSRANSPTRQHIGCSVCSKTICSCDKSYQHHTSSSSTKMASPSKKHHHSYRSSSGSGSSISSDNDEEFATIMNGGRADALITTMYHKVIAIEKDAKMKILDNKEIAKQFSEFQESMQTVATVEQVKTLTRAIDEQRQHLVAVVQGVVPIEPVDKALETIGHQMNEIQNYLNLPQPNPLSQRFHENDAILDVLGNRINEMSTAIGRAGMRIESVENSCTHFDARLSLSEIATNRIDLTSTKFNDLKELASHLDKVERKVSDISNSNHYMNSNLNKENENANASSNYYKQREQSSAYGSQGNMSSSGNSSSSSSSNYNSNNFSGRRVSAATINNDIFYKNEEVDSEESDDDDDDDDDDDEIEVFSPFPSPSSRHHPTPSSSITRKNTSGNVVPDSFSTAAYLDANSKRMEILRRSYQPSASTLSSQTSSAAHVHAKSSISPAISSSSSSRRQASSKINDVESVNARLAVLDKEKTRLKKKLSKKGGSE